MSEQNEQMETASTDLFGMVAFEEHGMPWTRCVGRYRLIKKETLQEFNNEPHWLVDLENGETTHIPESCVVPLTDHKQKE